MALGLIQEVDDGDEQRAKKMLATAAENPLTIPDALLAILDTIIKPLFSSSKHPQLTETGRKRLVPTHSIPGTFTSDHDSVFDTSRPWKNSWTTRLLLEMLSKHYHRLEPEPMCKKTIESHFHLVVPPILILIDDSDLNYKAVGCDCLSSLCQLLTSIKSPIMSRTGLSEVFIETLKNNFIYLPPLTPETESLHLLQSLYPAFFALVTASNPHSLTEDKSHPISQDVTNPNPRENPLRHQHDSNDNNSTKNLTLLLRHSLLYTLTSLSSFSDQNTTTSPAISTYLLSQLPLLTSRLGAATTQHVQYLIPLLRRIVSDPFATAAPDMLIASCDALERVLDVCGESVVRRWWAECLRGCVCCWMNLEDEDDDEDGRGKVVRDLGHGEKLRRVRVGLRRVVVLLRNGSNAVEFDRGREELIGEEAALRGLFQPVE